MASRLINGLVLVVLGAVLLMNTTGYLPWTVWDAAWGYWPVLLIGLGMQVVMTRWRFPGLALALVVILILAAMNPYGGPSPFREWFRWNQQRTPAYRPMESSKDWSVPLTASASKIDLRLVAPSMNVEARGDSGLNASQPGIAFTGHLSWNRMEPETNSSASAKDDIIRASVRSPSALDTDGGTQTWDFALNPSLATSLDVSGGVSNITLDMTSALLESVNVNSGITKLDLKLGLTGRETRVTVNGGVGNVTVQVPDAAGVKIDISSPLTVTGDFSKQGLTKSGNAWVTPDYENASTKVTISITCGTGKVSLQRTSLN